MQGFRLAPHVPSGAKVLRAGQAVIAWHAYVVLGHGVCCFLGGLAPFDGVSGHALPVIGRYPQGSAPGRLRVIPSAPRVAPGRLGVCCCRLLLWAGVLCLPEPLSFLPVVAHCFGVSWCGFSVGLVSPSGACCSVFLCWCRAVHAPCLPAADLFPPLVGHGCPHLVLEAVVPPQPRLVAVASTVPATLGATRPSGYTASSCAGSLGLCRPCRLCRWAVVQIPAPPPRTLGVCPGSLVGPSPWGRSFLVRPRWPAVCWVSLLLGVLLAWPRRAHL